ncbi:hypothetical protein GALL_333080 [mine drainage metagenome]|uniref:Uncharacterized protein n=1 Tax=mine drainage metagenome TaxID=410659 RepID=A0A1J5R9N8_9ZZZZ
MRRQPDDARDGLDEQPGPVRVDHRGRLVEHEQSRAHRHDTREGEPLALPAGQRRCRVRAAIGKPDQRHRLVDARPDELDRQAVVLEPERDVVAAPRQDGLRIRVLQEETGPRRPGHAGGGARRSRVEAVDLEHTLGLPRTVVQQPCRGGEQRRLARSAGSQQEDALPRRDIEVDPAQRPRLAPRVSPPPAAGAEPDGRGGDDTEVRRVVHLGPTPTTRAHRSVRAPA